MTIDKDAVKAEFIDMLRSTGREGVDYVIEEIERLGFFEAPASANHHLNVEGGLTQHSLNVAKAATINGNYVYVLPSMSMYKRMSTPNKIREMMTIPGFKTITFSGNMGVIRTLPGYASSIAFNIDNSNIRDILGTIAGDDTIFIVLREDANKDAVMFELSKVVPNMG